MSRSFLASSLAFGLGMAAASGLFWGLLNIPESSVLALMLSATVMLLIALAVEAGTGMAMALPNSTTSGEAVRRTIAALPSFLVGVLVFAALWWVTGRADAWWQASRGEIDATFLRYAGAPGTRPVHTTAAWLIWFVRWGLSLSIVAALMASGVAGGIARAGTGLRLALRPSYLALTTVAALLASQVLWRAVYWRPRSLPATSMEVVFAAAKFAILYAVATAIATFVLRVYAGRAAATDPRPATTGRP